MRKYSENLTEGKGCFWRFVSTGYLVIGPQSLGMRMFHSSSPAKGMHFLMRDVMPAFREKWGGQESPFCICYFSSAFSWKWPICQSGIFWSGLFWMSSHHFMHQICLLNLFFFSYFLYLFFQMEIKSNYVHNLSQLMFIRFTILLHVWFASLNR